MATFVFKSPGEIYMERKDFVEDIRALLCEHAASYPKLRPADAVKLLYQRAFSGEHLVTDEHRSLLKLEVEIAALGEDKNPPLFERLGDGVYRMHLLSALRAGLRPETINRMFILSARDRREVDVGAFMRSLQQLTDCCEDGALPFSPVELHSYLECYRAAGCPSVHHSEEYHRAYTPAYRLVDERFRRYHALFSAVDRMLSGGERPVLAVDGNSGAGKTRLAALLSEVYDCAVIHMDDFFLPAELRTKNRLDEVGGNIHIERFVDEVVIPLGRGNAFSYRPFCCGEVMDYGEAVTVEPKPLTVIEGVYSMHPQVREVWDLGVFLSVSGETQLRRIRERSGPELFKRFVWEWIPMENRYFRECQVEKCCDLTFYGEDA